MTEDYEQGDCCPISDDGDALDEKSVSFGRRTVRPDEYDAFVDKESARSRARQLGCIGIRQYDSSTGGFVWMPCSNESDYRRVTGRSPLGRRERRRILRNEIESIIEKKDLGPSIGSKEPRNMDPRTAVDADLDRLVLEGISTVNMGRGVPDPTPLGSDVPDMADPKKPKKIFVDPEKLRVVDEPAKPKLPEPKIPDTEILRPRSVIDRIKKIASSPAFKPKTKKPQKKKINYRTLSENTDSLLSDFATAYRYPERRATGMSEIAAGKLRIMDAALSPSERVNSGLAFEELSEKSRAAMAKVFQTIGSQSGNQNSSYINSQIAKNRSAIRPEATQPYTGAATLLGLLISSKDNSEIRKIYGIGESDLFSEDYLSSFEAAISSGSMPAVASYLLSDFNDMDEGARKAANLLGMSDSSLRRMRRAAESSGYKFGPMPNTAGIAKISSDPFEVASAAVLARSYLLDSAKRFGINPRMWRAVDELTGSSMGEVQEAFSSVLSSNSNYLKNIYGSSKNVSEYGNGLLRLARHVVADMVDTDFSDIVAITETTIGDDQAESGAMAPRRDSGMPKDVSEIESIFYPIWKRVPGRWSEMARDVQRALRDVRKFINTRGEPSKFMQYEVPQKEIGRIIVSRLPYSFDDYAREIAILQSILRDRVEFNLLPIDEFGVLSSGSLDPDLQDFSLYGKNGLLKNLFEDRGRIVSRTPYRDMVPKQLSLFRTISLLTEVLDAASNYVSETLLDAPNLPKTSRGLMTERPSRGLMRFFRFDKEKFLGRGIEKIDGSYENFTRFSWGRPAEPFVQRAENTYGDEVMDAIRATNEAWANTLLPYYSKLKVVPRPAEEAQALRLGFDEATEGTSERFERLQKLTDSLARYFDASYRRHSFPMEATGEPGSAPSKYAQLDQNSVYVDFYDGFNSLLSSITDADRPNIRKFSPSEIIKSISLSIEKLIDEQNLNETQKEIKENLAKKLIGQMEETLLRSSGDYSGYSDIGGDPSAKLMYEFLDRSTILPRIQRERSARRTRRIAEARGESGMMGGGSATPQPYRAALGETNAGVPFDKDYVKSGRLVSEMKEIDDNSKLFWESFENFGISKMGRRQRALFEEIKNFARSRELSVALSSGAPIIDGRKDEPYGEKDVNGLVSSFNSVLQANALLGIAKNTISFDKDKPWTANVLNFLLSQSSVGVGKLDKAFFGSHFTTSPSLNSLRFLPLKNMDKKLGKLRPIFQKLGIISDGQAIHFAMSGRRVSGTRKHSSPASLENNEAQIIGDILAMFMEGPESFSKYNGDPSDDTDPRKDPNSALGNGFEYSYGMWIRDPRNYGLSDSGQNVPLLSLADDPAKDFELRNTFRSLLHDLWDKTEETYGKRIGGRPSPVLSAETYVVAARAEMYAEQYADNIATLDDFAEIMNVATLYAGRKSFNVFGEIRESILERKRNEFPEISPLEISSVIFNKMSPELKKIITDENKKTKTKRELFYAAWEALTEIPEGWNDDAKELKAKNRKDWESLGKKIGETGSAADFYRFLRRGISSNRAENDDVNREFLDLLAKEYITRSQMSVILTEIAPGLLEGIASGESGMMSDGGLSEQDQAEKLARRSEIEERIKTSRFLSSLGDPTEEIDELAEKKEKFTEWKRQRLLDLVSSPVTEPNDADWFVYAAVGGFYGPMSVLFSRDAKDPSRSKIDFFGAKKALQKYLANASPKIIDELFGWLSAAISGTQDAPRATGEDMERSMYYLDSSGNLPPTVFNPENFARSDNAKTEISYVDKTSKEPRYDADGNPIQKTPAQIRAEGKPIKQITPYGKLVQSVLDGGINTGLISWEDIPLSLLMDIASGKLPLVDLPKYWHQSLADEDLDLIPSEREIKAVTKQVKLADKRFALEIMTGEKISPTPPEISKAAIKRDFVATPEQATQNQALDELKPKDGSSVKAFVETLSPNQLTKLGDMFGAGTGQIPITTEMSTAANGGLGKIALSVRDLAVKSAKRVSLIKRMENGENLVADRLAAIVGDESIAEEIKSIASAVASGDETSVLEAIFAAESAIDERFANSILKPMYDLAAKDGDGNDVPTLDPDRSEAEKGLQWTRNLLEHVLSLDAPIKFMETRFVGMKTGTARRALIGERGGRTADLGAEKEVQEQASFDKAWMKRFVAFNPVDGVGYRFVEVQTQEVLDKKAILAEKIKNFSGSSSEAAEIISMMSDLEVEKFLIQKVYPALVAKKMADKFAYGKLAKANAELDMRLRSITRRMRRSSSAIETLELMENAIAEAFDGRTRDMLSPEELAHYGDLVAYFVAGGREMMSPSQYGSALKKMRQEARDVVSRLARRTQQEEDEKDQFWVDMMNPPIEQSILEALQRAKDPQSAADLVEQDELRRIMGATRIPGVGLRRFAGQDENLGEETFWEMFRPDRVDVGDEIERTFGEGSPFSDSDSGAMTVTPPPSPSDQGGEEESQADVSIRDRTYTSITPENARNTFGQWTYELIFKNYSSVFGGRGTGAPYLDPQIYPTAPLTRNPNHYDRARRAIDAMWRLTQGAIPETVRERLEDNDEVSVSNAAAWLGDLIYATAEYMRKSGTDVPDGYDPTDSENKNNDLQKPFLDNMAEVAFLALYFPWAFKIPVRSSGTDGATDWVPQGDDGADFVIDGLNSAERPTLLFNAYHEVRAGDFSVSETMHPQFGKISRWIYDPTKKTAGNIVTIGGTLDQYDVSSQPETEERTPSAGVVEEEVDDGTPLSQDEEIRELQDFIEAAVLRPFGGDYVFRDWLHQADRYSRILGVGHYEKNRTEPGLVERISNEPESLDADRVISELLKKSVGTDFDIPDSLSELAYLEFADPDFGPPFPDVSDDSAVAGAFENLSRSDIASQRKIGVTSTSKASKDARAKWWSLLQSGKDIREISSSEKTNDGVNWHPSVVEAGIKKHAKDNGIADSVVDKAIDDAEKSANARNIGTARLRAIATLKEIVEKNPGNLAKVFLDVEDRLKQLEQDRKETSNQYQERVRGRIQAAAKMTDIVNGAQKLKLAELEKLVADEKISKREAREQYRKHVQASFEIIKQLTNRIKRLERDSRASRSALQAIDEEIQEIKNYIKKAANAVNVSVEAISKRMEMMRAIKNGISSADSDSGMMGVVYRVGDSFIELPRNNYAGTRREPRRLLSSLDKEFVNAIVQTSKIGPDVPRSAMLVLPTIRAIRSGVTDETVGVPNLNSADSVAVAMRKAMNNFAAKISAEEFLREKLGDRFVNFSSLGLNLMPARTRRIAEDASLDGITVSMANNGVTESDVVNAMIMHSEATERAKLAILGYSASQAAEYLEITVDAVNDAINTESQLSAIGREISRANAMARKLSETQGRKYVSNFVKRKFSDLVEAGLPEERLLYPSMFARNQAIAVAQNAVTASKKYGLYGEGLRAVSGADEDVTRLVSYVGGESTPYAPVRINNLPSDWHKMNFSEKNSWLSSEEALRAFGRFGVMTQAQITQDEMDVFGIPDGPVTAMAAKIFDNENMIPSMMTETGMSRIFSANPPSDSDFVRSGSNSYAFLESRLPRISEMSDAGLARFMNSEENTISDFRAGNTFLSARLAERLAKSVGLDYEEIWGARRPSVANNVGHFYWLAKNWESAGKAISMIGEGAKASEIAASIGEDGQRIAQRVSSLISSGVVDAFYDELRTEEIGQEDINNYLSSLALNKRRDAISLMASAGYSEPEIVSTTKFNPNTVRNVLREARMSGIAPAAVGSKEWTRKNSQAIRADASNGISKRELMRKYGIGARTLNSILAKTPTVSYRSAYESDSGAMASRRLSEEMPEIRREMSESDENSIRNGLGISKDIVGRDIGLTPGAPILAHVADPFDAKNGAHLNADGTEKNIPVSLDPENVTRMWQKISDHYVSYFLSGGRIRRNADSYKQVKYSPDEPISYFKTQMDEIQNDHEAAAEYLWELSISERMEYNDLFAFFGTEENFVLADPRTPFKPYGPGYKSAMEFAIDFLANSDSENAIEDLLKNPKVLFAMIPDGMKNETYSEVVTDDLTDPSEPSSQRVQVSGFNDREDLDVLAFLVGASVGQNVERTVKTIYRDPVGKALLYSVGVGNIDPMDAVEIWDESRNDTEEAKRMFMEATMKKFASWRNDAESLATSMAGESSFFVNNQAIVSDQSDADWGVRVFMDGQDWNEDLAVRQFLTRTRDELSGKSQSSVVARIVENMAPMKTPPGIRIYEKAMRPMKEAFYFNPSESELEAMGTMRELADFGLSFVLPSSGADFARSTGGALTPEDLRNAAEMGVEISPSEVVAQTMARIFTPENYKDMEDMYPGVENMIRWMAERAIASEIARSLESGPSSRITDPEVLAQINTLVRSEPDIFPAEASRIDFSVPSDLAALEKLVKAPNISTSVPMFKEQDYAVISEAIPYMLALMGTPEMGEMQKPAMPPFVGLIPGENEDEDRIFVTEGEAAIDSGLSLDSTLDVNFWPRSTRFSQMFVEAVKRSEKAGMPVQEIKEILDNMTPRQFALLDWVFSMNESLLNPLVAWGSIVAEGSFGGSRRTVAGRLEYPGQAGGSMPGIPDTDIPLVERIPTRVPTRTPRVPTVGEQKPEDEIRFGTGNVNFGGTEPNEVIDDQVYGYVMDQVFKRLASYASKSSDMLVDEVIYNSPTVQKLRTQTDIGEESIRSLLDDAKESTKVVAMIISDLLAETITRRAANELATDLRIADFETGDESSSTAKKRKWLEAVRPRRDFYGFWSMYGPDIVYSLPDNDQPYSPVWTQDEKITEPFVEAVRGLLLPDNIREMVGARKDFSDDEILDELERTPSSWWWERAAKRNSVRMLGTEMKTPEELAKGTEAQMSRYVLDMSADELAQYLLSMQETSSGRRSEESGLTVTTPTMPEILRKAFGQLEELTFQDLPYKKLDEWTGTIVAEMNPRDVTPERVKEELKRIFPYLGDGDEDVFPVVGTSFEESMEALSMLDGFRTMASMAALTQIDDENVEMIAELTSQDEDSVRARLAAMMRFPELFSQEAVTSPEKLIDAMGYAETEKGRKARFSRIVTIAKNIISAETQSVAEKARSLEDLQRAARMLTNPDAEFSKMTAVASSINEYIDMRLASGEITRLTAYRLKAELRKVVMNHVFGGETWSRAMAGFAGLLPRTTDPERLANLSMTMHEARNGYQTIYDRIISSGTSPFVGEEATFPTLMDIEKSIMDFESETGETFDRGASLGLIGSAGEAIPSIEIMRRAAQGMSMEFGTQTEISLPRPKTQNQELMAILEGLASAQEIIYSQLRDEQKAIANLGVFGSVKTMRDVGREISEMTRKNDAVRERYKLIGRYKDEVLDPAAERFADNQEENLQTMKTFKEWLSESGYGEMLGEEFEGDSDSGAMSTTALVASRYNDPARFAIVYGADESISDNTKFITTGHLLLGAWRIVESALEPENSVTLSDLSSVSDLRNALQAATKEAGKDRGADSRWTDFSKAARKAIKNSVVSASQRGADLIDISDLVNALLLPDLNEGEDDGLSDALSQAGISVAETILRFQNYLEGKKQIVNEGGASESGQMTAERAEDARRNAVKERTRAQLSHRARWFNPFGAYLLGRRNDQTGQTNVPHMVSNVAKIEDKALVDEVIRLGDAYATSLTAGVLPEQDFRFGESPFDDVPERPLNSILIYGELGQRPNDLVGAIRDAMIRAESMVVNQRERDRLNQYVADMKLMFDNYMHVDEMMGGDSGAMADRVPKRIEDMISPIKDMFAKEEKYGQKKYYEHIYGPVVNAQAELMKAARIDSYRSRFLISENLKISSDDIQWSTNDWVYKRDDKFIEAADAVIVKMKDGDFSTAHVAMISRKSGPFRGALSTVGGLRDGDEDLMVTASREAMEEVGLTEDMILQAVPLGVIEAPDWDPRFANGIRVGGGMFVVPWDTELSAGSDASGAEWVSLADLASGQKAIGFGHAEWLRRAVSSMEINPETDPYGELRTSIARRLAVLSKAARLRNQRIIERINDIRRATGKPLLLSSGKMPHPMMPWGKKVARSIWSFGKQSDSDSGAMSAELGKDLRVALGLEDPNGRGPTSPYIESTVSNARNADSQMNNLGATHSYYGVPSLDMDYRDPGQGSTSAEKVRGMIEQSLKSFLDPNNWTLGTRATSLWIPYIDRSVARAASNRNTDPNAIPMVYVLGGPSGSGKTYLRNTGYEGVPNYEKAVVADPDDAKIVTPEFAYFAEPIGKLPNGKPMFRSVNVAAALHEESRVAANALFLAGLNSGLDVVYDTSGQFRDGNTLGITKSLGYGVRGYYVFGQQGLLEQRTAERGDKTGRFVPKGMSATIGSNLGNIIPQNLHYFDELQILDSSVGVDRMKVVAVYKKLPNIDISKAENGTQIGEWQVISPIFFKYVKQVGPAGAGSEEMQRNPRKYSKIPVTFDQYTMSKW